MGAFANKMGTVVEDIVAPNISGIARKYFEGIEFEKIFQYVIIEETELILTNKRV